MIKGIRFWRPPVREASKNGTLTKVVVKEKTKILAFNFELFLRIMPTDNPLNGWIYIILAGGCQTPAKIKKRERKYLIHNNNKNIPYFNTNESQLAIDFHDHINRKMLKLKGYMCAKFTSRVDEKYIEKYGKYRIGINMWQSDFLQIKPTAGSMFSEHDVKNMLATNQDKK